MGEVNNMDKDKIENLFQNVLAKDEILLWVGQSDIRKIFTRLDLFLIPFSILWCGFAIYWEYLALFIMKRQGHDPGLFSPLFGLLFVLMGFYLVVGRFFYKNYQKKNTFYALTNQRIFILPKTAKQTLRTLGIHQISAIHQSIDSAGIGTLIFGKVPMFGSFYGNTGLDFLASQYNNEVMAFYDIPKAEAVYCQINDLQNS
jgi:hypothetical protein